MDSLIFGVIFGNLLIPTSVISCSIYGCIRYLNKDKGVSDVEIDSNVRGLRDGKMVVLAGAGAAAVAGGVVTAATIGSRSTTTNDVTYHGCCCGGDGDDGGCGDGCGGGCG